MTYKAKTTVSPDGRDLVVEVFEPAEEPGAQRPCVEAHQLGESVAVAAKPGAGAGEHVAMPLEAMDKLAAAWLEVRAVPIARAHYEAAKAALAAREQEHRAAWDALQERDGDTAADRDHKWDRYNAAEWDRIVAERWLDAKRDKLEALTGEHVDE